MARKFHRKSILSVREQAARLRSAFPRFATRVSGAWLTSVGEIRPTALSASYRVEIRYRVGKPPDVRVLSPALACRQGEEKIPHMYGQERLCLYFPPADEWSGEMSLGDAFIPWISLWLFYYEMWHATGEWLGGGHEPEVKDLSTHDSRHGDFDRGSE
jgi:hypothetical protein